MVSSPKEYIERNLGGWILSDPEFNGKYEVVSTEAKTSDQLDGFMATIFMCDVVLKPTKAPNEDQRSVAVVVKAMKGSHDFRVSSKSYVQCRNEMFIYDKVIPYFKQFIKSHNSSIDSNHWIPKIYHSYYGKIPELSEIDECYLAMENLSVSGFRNGPRLELDINHFRIMLKTISEYHAVQYAMRIEGDPMLETLKSGLTTLRWKEDPGSVPNLFEMIFPPAFERMFDYLDRHPEVFDGRAQMKEEVELMRTKFGNDPVTMLELFREDDEKFSLILHGDYNRNNVMFQYDDAKDPNTPIGLRMIDFQEVRYASPAIDVFFFFYMSSTKEFREKHWDELIRLYHEGVWNNLKELLQCDDNDPKLAPYSMEAFNKHFSRFAFYGVLVPIHFLTWMAADPEELEPLANEFTHDMKSEKCRQMMLTVGGEAANKKVSEALQHACDMGYLSFIKDL